MQFTDSFSFMQGLTLGPALQQQTQICGLVAGRRTVARICLGTLVAMIIVRFARILLVVETSYNWVSKRQHDKIMILLCRLGRSHLGLLTHLDHHRLV